LEKILARFVTICVILYALHGDYKIIGFFKYHTSHVAKNKKKWKDVLFARISPPSQNSHTTQMLVSAWCLHFKFYSNTPPKALHRSQSSRLGKSELIPIIHLWISSTYC